MERESHYVWGKRDLLTVTECDEPPAIELKHSRMLLRVRPGTDEDKRRALVEAWYREQLKGAVPPLLERWQPRLGVQVERWFVQRMKTKWGSCNHKARTIRLNIELGKKPAECLEYIVVHELVHLLEPTHNARFYRIDGPLYAQVAAPSPGAQSAAGAAGEVELLRPKPWDQTA